MEARTLYKLTARSIAACKKPGRYSDGGNLYLSISPSGRKSWSFMFMRQGKQREAGLGSLRVVSAAAAREKAQEYRLLLAKGCDPIDSRRLAACREGVKTFGDCAKELVASKRAGWRSTKHAEYFASSLTTNCAPIAHTPVAEVETVAILKIIQPLWIKTPVSASRLLNRIAATLDFAKAHGWRDGENPARFQGHLENILPKHTRAKQHFSSMPYAKLPAFLQQLQARPSTQASALTFIILSAVRLSEALQATWDEMSIEHKLWTIPATRMKAGREHRVPLSSQAMQILERAAELRTGELVFPGRHSNKKPLAASTLALLLPQGCTIHGMRSSFRDYCSERTEFSREVIELSLAHSFGSAVELAYRRTDLLEKRKELMQKWSNFLFADKGLTSGKAHLS